MVRDVGQVIGLDAPSISLLPADGGGIVVRGRALLHLVRVKNDVALGRRGAL